MEISATATSWARPLNAARTEHHRAPRAPEGAGARSEREETKRPREPIGGADITQAVALGAALDQAVASSDDPIPPHKVARAYAAALAPTAVAGPVYPVDVTV